VAKLRVFTRPALSTNQKTLVVGKSFLTIGRGLWLPLLCGLLFRT